MFSERDIKIYRPTKEREQSRIDLYEDYKDFLEANNRGNKSYETIMHDATVLEEVRHLRSTAESSLEAKAVLITCDYYLYRFDWEQSRRSRDRACVLLPNVLWQALRPFIPVDHDFDKSFAETFALPEFRALGGEGAKACSTMLSILATYKDVPEETAFNLLSNDQLLDELKPIRDRGEFEKQVEAAFVQENSSLLEEKAALEQQVERERVERQQLERDFRAQKDELESARAAIGESTRSAEEAEARANKAERESTSASTRFRRESREAERAKASSFRLAVTAGLLLGILLALIFELIVWLLPVAGIRDHENSIGLQIGISAALLFGATGLLVQQWRAWCWGTAALGFVTVVLSLI